MVSPVRLVSSADSPIINSQSQRLKWNSQTAEELVETIVCRHFSKSCPNKDLIDHETRPESSLLSEICQDCWYGVEDAVERKRIQNRLAQRKRRLHNALSRGNPRQHQAKPRNITYDMPSKLDDSMPSLWSPMSTMTVAQVPMLKSSETIVTELPPSIFSALYNNGAMIGLTCGTTVPAKSMPVGPNIPWTLHPTVLQLTTIHPSWIDRWPFQKFRDNAIIFSGLFDEEAFLSDLFSMESFSLKPGKPGWDPTAWYIGRKFAEKWGFLFN